MRLTRLDFLRGVAAATVILSHYRMLLSPPGSLVTSPELPLLNLLWPLYNYGSYAVPFFWLKPSDRWVVSLCAWHHREQHKIGEASFEHRYGLDLKRIAAVFAQFTPRRFKLGD